MLEIEVHCDAPSDPLHPSILYKPYPASENIPTWFDRLGIENHGSLTVKRCRGVADIINSGYLINWPFDATILKNNEDKLEIIRTRTMDRTPFHPHPSIQVEGYPDFNLHSQANGIDKITTPYRIVTPPGTSILVQQPPYRPELKVDVMPGIIDSDTFYGEFNVLFMIKDYSGDRKIKIKAGTPLAQIIPFVRGEWEIKYDKINPDKLSTSNALSENVDSFYTKYLWEKKVYK